MTKKTPEATKIVKDLSVEIGQLEVLAKNMYDNTFGRSGLEPSIIYVRDRLEGILSKIGDLSTAMYFIGVKCKMDELGYYTDNKSIQYAIVGMVNYLELMDGECDAISKHASSPSMFRWFGEKDQWVNFREQFDFVHTKTLNFRSAWKG